jgi:hypothetical protein
MKVSVVARVVERIFLRNIVFSFFSSMGKNDVFASVPSFEILSQNMSMSFCRASPVLPSTK